MKVSDAGVNLIKEFEGFPHNGSPYRDPIGIWTIGYGHTKGVGPNSPRLTQAQALALLKKELDDEYGPAINNLGVPLNQHQFDALISFVYNCGTGAVSEKTKVGRALRARQWKEAADHLLEWDKAGGKTLPGLTRRRKAERALFLEEDDPFEGFTDNERSWIREYDRLLREKKDPDRRRALREQMAQQRKQIWRAAQPPPKGDGKGWDHAHRRQRFASLQARTS